MRGRKNGSANVYTQRRMKSGRSNSLVGQWDHVSASSNTADRMVPRTTAEVWEQRHHDLPGDYRPPPSPIATSPLAPAVVELSKDSECNSVPPVGWETGVSHCSSTLGFFPLAGGMQGQSAMSGRASDFSGSPSSPFLAPRQFPYGGRWRGQALSPPVTSQLRPETTDAHASSARTSPPDFRVTLDRQRRGSQLLHHSRELPGCYSPLLRPSLDNEMESTQIRPFYPSRSRPMRSRDPPPSTATRPSVEKPVEDSAGWSSLFNFGAPIRILLPEQCIGPLTNGTGKLGSLLKFPPGDMTVKLLKDHDIPHLRDSIVFLSGPSREQLHSTLVDICLELRTFLAHLSASSTPTVADKDVSQRGIVILIPERAASMVIGYKGTTINRISKYYNCDIRTLSSLKPFVYRGYTDRTMSLRSNEVSNIATTILHIDSMLTDMLLKHKLSEADIVFALRPPLDQQSETSMLGCSPVGHVAVSFGNQPMAAGDAANDEALAANVSVTPPAKHGSLSGGRLPNDLPVPRRSVSTVISHTPNNSAVHQGAAARHRSQDARMTLERTATLSPNIHLSPAAFSLVPHFFHDVINNRKDYVSLKLVISKSHAAWVIGNAGLRKKEIEAVSSSTIKIHNHPSESLVEDVPDGRVLIIKGSPVALGKAVNLILVGYDTQERRATTVQGASVRLVMSQASINCLVDPSRKMLNSIAKRSSASLFVLATGRPDTQLIHIRGVADQKVTAIMLILDCLLRHRKRLSSQRQGQQPSSSVEPSRSKRRRGNEVRSLGEKIKTIPPLVATAGPAVGDIGDDLSKKHTLLYSDNNQVRPQRKVTFEPPEATFLQRVVEGVTYPRVITTSTKYTMSVSFGLQYKELVDDLGSEAFHEIEAMVNYRVGSSVQIIRVDDDSHGFQSIGMDETITPKHDQHAPGSERKPHLQFELTGTPVGNSTAVLLLHEVLMNLEQQRAATPAASAKKFATDINGAAQQSETMELQDKVNDDCPEANTDSLTCNMDSVMGELPTANPERTLDTSADILPIGETPAGVIHVTTSAPE